MRVLDSDGRKAVLSGKVVPGSWVRVDGETHGADTGYSCKCNRQSQCQCSTERKRKWPSVTDVLSGYVFSGDVYEYGVVAKMRKKHVLQHLGADADSALKAQVEAAPQQLNSWPPALVAAVNKALHTTQRARKIKAGLPLIDCAAQCTPAGHPVLKGATYDADRCEDNGLGGCSTEGWCCSKSCPC